MPRWKVSWAGALSLDRRLCKPLTKINQAIAEPTMPGVVFGRFMPYEVNRKAGNSQRNRMRFKMEMVCIEMCHAPRQRTDQIGALYNHGHGQEVRNGDGYAPL